MAANDNNDIEDDANDDSDGVGGSIKRAPSSGFFGMRGKKLFFTGEDGNTKRAPSGGFFGMRGKKWDPNANDDDDDVSEFVGADEKRAPSVGFHGECNIFRRKNGHVKNLFHPHPITVRNARQKGCFTCDGRLCGETSTVVVGILWHARQKSAVRFFWHTWQKRTV